MSSELETVREELSKVKGELLKEQQQCQLAEATQQSLIAEKEKVLHEAQSQIECLKKDMSGKFLIFRMSPACFSLRFFLSDLFPLFDSFFLGKCEPGERSSLVEDRC